MFREVVHDHGYRQQNDGSRKHRREDEEVTLTVHLNGADYGDKARRTEALWSVKAPIGHRGGAGEG
jgi:hypothetical protein